MFYNVLKNNLLIVVVFISAGVSSLAAQEPDFRLRDLDNQWIEYSDIKGSRLTVIDFWSTWCQPCVRSIPLLNELSEELKKEGVNFVGISVDGTRNQSKIKPFVQSMGISYPVVRDVNNDLMSDLGISAIPTLLVYDSEGNRIYLHEGFRPGDETIIREEILAHLKE
jgi:thiol-disulfide isomerase/thioredoxin